MSVPRLCGTGKLALGKSRARVGERDHGWSGQALMSRAELSRQREHHTQGPVAGESLEYSRNHKQRVFSSRKRREWSGQVRWAGGGLGRSLEGLCLSFE